MGKTAFEGANRKDTFFLPPEAFTIVTDPAHELFDERALEPFSEPLVQSLMAQGQLQPITIRRNGKTDSGDNIIEVLIGRGRVKAVIEANRRLESVGKPPMKVHFQQVSMSEEKELLAAIIAENEIRRPDPPSIKARKLHRLIQRGASEKEAADAFGITIAECKKLLKLMELCKEATTAIDDGRLSLSAASRLVGVSRAEQKELLKSLAEDGVKMTAERIERKRVVDSGIPAPKAKRMMTRIQIEKLRDKSTHDEMSEHDKGFVAALNMVLGEDNGE